MNSSSLYTNVWVKANDWERCTKQVLTWWTYIKPEHLNNVIYGYIQIEYASIGSVHDNLHKHDRKL